jgi:hypothetical protein
MKGEEGTKSVDWQDRTREKKNPKARREKGAKSFE